MIRLKPTYAKILDRITIEEAPSEFGGVKGFNNSKQLCNEHGYYQVVFTEQTGNVAIYDRIDDKVIQSWVLIDHEQYASTVTAEIRLKYDENQELAILRKKLSGIYSKEFDEYTKFCEKVKHDVKMSMI